MPFLKKEGESSDSEGQNKGKALVFLLFWVCYHGITILWYGGRIKKAGGMASEGNDKMSGLQTRKSNFWNERISDLGKRPG